MNQYLNLLRDIMDTGYDTDDRTGTGTRSVFGRQLRFNMNEGFPLVTTKKVYTRAIIEELLFFIRGESNSRILENKKVNIWSDWADPHGNLGPIYGVNWRNWGGKIDNVPQPTPVCAEEVTVYGVASSKGYLKGKSESHDKLYHQWRGIISRCYNPNDDSYQWYGYKGVSVCDEWLTFENFDLEVRALEGWLNKLQYWSNFELDKDIKGNGFVYSKETCTWVTKAENQRARYSKVYYVLDENKNTHSFRIASDFINLHGLNQGNFNSMLRGERKSAQGFTLVKVEDESKGVDQLANVIEGIRTNPTGRRHIISAWNVPQIDDMALPPCHCLMQFKVYGDTLHLQLYQRSADVFLGVPFNIASYALLLAMVAQVTGLKAGEFVHTFGDVHIYNNHKEQVLTQLERKPHKLPTLVLNPEIKEIDDFTFEDIEIKGYESWPTIKGEVSV